MTEAPSPSQKSRATRAILQINRLSSQNKVIISALSLIRHPHVKMNNFLHLAILILTLSLGGGVQAQAGREQVAIPADEVRALSETEHLHHEALLERAANDGMVPVIVEFRTRLTPEPSLPDQASVLSQRNRLETVRQQVLDRLAMTPASEALFNVKRFDLFPGFSVHANPATLQNLFQDPAVLRVVEDTLESPLLAESVPLIGSDLSGTFAGRTGFGQVVAVLDTGVDKYHPFLQGKVVSEACYSTNLPEYGIASLCPGGVASSTAAESGQACPSNVSGCSHGTHVAGIVAGNTATLTGVAQDAGIIAIQVFSQFPPEYCGDGAVTPCVRTYSSDIIKALERVYALRDTFNIASVNMSLGGGAYQAHCDGDVRKPAIDNLRLAGIATVIASGNDGETQSISAPACISSAISVGSTTKSDAVSSFSNSADILDMLAPGSSIRSSVLGDGYAYYNGTSMAAPHVAGAWAVLKGAEPTATVDAILESLVDTGQPVTDYRTGASQRSRPRIQVAEALAALDAGGSPTTFSLNVMREGNGTVSSAPVGIQCGSSCSTTFSAGSSVSLNATPADGWEFGGWSGACSGTGSCTLTMSQSHSVTATFFMVLLDDSPIDNLFGVQGSYQRFVVDVPSGASSLVISISGGSGDADLYVRFGAQPTLQTWDCRPWLDGNAESCAFSTAVEGRYHVLLHGYTAFSGVTLTASYQTQAAMHTLNVLRFGNGTVTSDPAGIQCGATCSSLFASDTPFTLVAAPDSGCSFAGWAGECTGLNQTCTLALQQTTTLSAFFSQNIALNQTIDSISGGEGEGTDRLFSLVMRSAARELSIETSGGSGNADLYVTRNNRPDLLSAADCGSSNPGNSETCQFGTAPAGTYYILIRGVTGYSDLQLRVNGRLVDPMVWLPILLE